MKAIISLLFCVLSFGLAAQTQEMEQLKLDMEKLAQFKLILSQMKQGYQTLQNGYNAVSDAAKGNFNLHKNYLDGLLVASPSVKQSPALQQIASDNVAIVKLFQTAMQQFQMSGLFSAAELADLRSRYGDCNSRINDDLDVLEQVTSSGKLRMSDAERLQAMDGIRADITAQLASVKTMIGDYHKVQALRFQQRKDNDAIKVLSGLK